MSTQLEQQLKDEQETGTVVSQALGECEKDLASERETSRYWHEQWVERGAQLQQAQDALEAFSEYLTETAKSLRTMGDNKFADSMVRFRNKTLALAKVGK